MKPLPLPDFYDPAQARDFGYRPDAHALLAAAGAWRRQHRLRAAAEDGTRVRLLVVDAQKDFCFPEGSLYVGGRSGEGALGDNDRLARFVYANLAAISEITCTLDTHFPFQVFTPAFWVDAKGEPPAPHSEVTTEQIRSGQLRPNPDVAAFAGGGDAGWLERYAEHYSAELERSGKYRLYLWPVHCLLGSDGHTLAGVVHAARLFHAYARTAPNGVEAKGGHTLTENYSALAPEVLTAHDGTRIAGRSEALVESLLAEDVLIVTGQAASHCVRFTLDDLLVEIRARDPRLARKVYLLADCASAVAVPDPNRPGAFLQDFTPQVEEAHARYREAGMHLVESTTPLAEWPGVPALE